MNDLESYICRAEKKQDSLKRCYNNLEDNLLNHIKIRIYSKIEEHIKKNQRYTQHNLPNPPQDDIFEKLLQYKELIDSYEFSSLVELWKYVREKHSFRIIDSLDRLCSDQTIYIDDNSQRPH